MTLLDVNCNCSHRILLWVKKVFSKGWLQLNGNNGQKKLMKFFISSFFLYNLGIISLEIFKLMNISSLLMVKYHQFHMNESKHEQCRCVLELVAVCSGIFLFVPYSWLSSPTSTMSPRLYHVQCWCCRLCQWIQKRTKLKE